MVWICIIIIDEIDKPHWVVMDIGNVLWIVDELMESSILIYFLKSS